MPTFSPLNSPADAEAPTGTTDQARSGDVPRLRQLARARQAGGRRPVLIAPSLLAADPLRLADEATAVQAAGADWLHLDVMDGHFVPNLSFGPHFAAALRQQTPLPVDVHLMVEQPQAIAQAFCAAGVDHITVHVEAVRDVAGFCAWLRDQGVSVGLSLRPQTPVAAVVPYLRYVDLVLLMSVAPGFGGQRFLPPTCTRLQALAAAREAQNLPLLLEVDGGIDATTAPAVRAAGADTLVAGSAIFPAKSASNATSPMSPTSPTSPTSPMSPTRIEHYRQKIAAIRL